MFSFRDHPELYVGQAEFTANDVGPAAELLRQFPNPADPKQGIHYYAEFEPPVPEIPPPEGKRGFLGRSPKPAPLQAYVLYTEPGGPPDNPHIISIDGRATPFLDLLAARGGSIPATWRASPGKHNLMVETPTNETAEALLELVVAVVDAAVAQPAGATWRLHIADAEWSPPQHYNE